MRPWEIIERGYFPTGIIRRRLVTGTLFLLRFSIINLGKIRKLGRAGRQERRYVRPPRSYTLPAYQSEMRYCKLNQKYLRQTLYCDSHAPAVIALAYSLGAYRKSGREFAESAFEFVKRNIGIELLPLDGVEETLRRGTGSCLHRVTLLVALCRAAGIPTRYKMYTLTSIDTLDETLVGDRMGKQWSNEVGNLLVHAEAEMYLDGEWVIGSIGLTPERQASLNLPITRFGEVTLGVWYSADPGSIVQVESIPWGINMLMRLVNKTAPAAIDKANANLLEQCQRGRAILAEQGEQAYDSQARVKFKPRMPEAIREIRREITFER